MAELRGEQPGSIFEHIRAHLPPAGSGLLDGGADLPDEADQQGAVRWAAGAWDGVATHHMRGEQSQLADALARSVRAATSGWFASRHYARVYEQARDRGLVNALDPLLQRLRGAGLRPDRLHALGLRLATEAAHRGPVKLGIALLGLFPVEHHREVLLTLGRHEEFTLYAAVALGNGQDDAVENLWSLARQVTGWGRIHLVERLADVERADVRDWILRAGFRNSVTDEYLAYLAATCGDLVGRLRGEVDDDLLHAAGDILSALFVGGPAEDIGDYAEGAEVTELFLSHMQDRARDLRHLLAVHAVREYVSREDPDEEWPPGWSPHRRQRMREQCTEILNRAHWPELARAELASTEPPVFHRADRACRVLGISSLSTHLRWLRDDPRLAASWYAVMAQADETNIDQVLQLAVESLPLDQIATGPADELGLGPAFAAHTALDYVLQGLSKWPGRGLPLILAALRSPVTRNRNMAARALSGWPRETWPADAEAVLRRATAAEPNEDAKERMSKVLRGEPLDTL